MAAAREVVHLRDSLEKTLEAEVREALNGLHILTGRICFMVPGVQLASCLCIPDLFVYRTMFPCAIFWRPWRKRA
jgi:hypothetical protein